MSARLANALHLLILCALVTLAAWPCFVLVATAIGLWGGEARQIDAWAMEPRREMLTQFMQGWRESLIVALPIGCIVAIDYLLLSRYRSTWWFGGLLLPLTAIAVAVTLYATPEIALPTLLGTSLVLLVLYRAFEWLRHRRLDAR